MSKEQNVYQKHGYNNRRAYLQDLALEYSINEQVVFFLADMLGPSEDFDGLICALEDFEVV